MASRYRMFRACEQNNLRLLQNKFKQQLRKDKASVQKTVSEKKDGLTPLIRACRRGHIKVVRYLVSVCRADIHQVADWSAFYHDMQGASPLLCAVVAGHLRIVEFLIRAGADVNSTSHPKWTPLRVATYLGLLDIVRVLLDNGADLELATWHGYPHPIANKWTFGHQCIVILLYVRFVDDSQELADLLAYDMYHFCIQEKPIYDFNNLPDLILRGIDSLIELRHTDIAIKYIDYLLRCLIVEAQRIDGEFNIAINYNLMDRIWQLQGHMSMDTAKKFICEHLRNLVALEKEKDLHVYGGATMLRVVCSPSEEDHPIIAVSMARCLLKLGANVNARSTCGTTPLHEASSARPFNVQLVDLLIRNGAHIDLVNADNETPMDLQPTDDASVSELRYPVRHQTLQCLAARTVCKHNVPYDDKTVTQVCIEAIEKHKCKERY